MLSPMWSKVVQEQLHGLKEQQRMRWWPCLRNKRESWHVIRPDFQRYMYITVFLFCFVVVCLFDFAGSDLFSYMYIYIHVCMYNVYLHVHAIACRKRSIFTIFIHFMYRSVVL